MQKGSLMIDKIISIAREAGRIVVDIQRSGDLDVCAKEDGSPVTRADNASDKYIRDALHDQFRIPVITEETTIDYSIRKNWNEFFLIDPLDGTKEFIEGVPHFVVSVALVKKKEPVIENHLEEDNVTSEQEIIKNAFDPEEIETDEDINQETDEELLDIPTFLRRQAN